MKLNVFLCAVSWFTTGWLLGYAVRLPHEEALPFFWMIATTVSVGVIQMLYYMSESKD